MKMPFSTEQFLGVFKAYNQSVFPAQILLNLAAVIVLFLILKKYRQSNQYVSIILAFLWLWMGIVYHIVFFSKINPAAYVFGALFIIQGILFLLYGIFLKKLSFTFNNNAFSITASVLIFYALIIYPALGLLSGHSYPSSPTFGLPCPTTIFTFGILMLAEKKMYFLLMVIPILWSLLGFSAVMNFSIYEDTGLLIAGLTAIIGYILQKRSLAELKAA